jgi:hypothetical protein
MQVLNQMTIQNALSPIMQEMTDWKLQREIDGVKSAHQDFDQYESAVVDILQNDQYLRSHPNRLEIAYKLAKSQNVGQLTQTALQNGIQQGYNNAIGKQVVSTQGGAQGTGQANAQPKSPEEELIANILGARENRGIF